MTRRSAEAPGPLPLFELPDTITMAELSAADPGSGPLPPVKVSERLPVQTGDLKAGHDTVAPECNASGPARTPLTSLKSDDVADAGFATQPSAGDGSCQMTGIAPSGRRWPHIASRPAA